MNLDRFWQRSGFWTALIATIPLVFAILQGTVTEELVAATIAAWGTFFTASAMRPTVGGKDLLTNAQVMGVIQKQQEVLAALKENHKS